MNPIAAAVAPAAPSRRPYPSVGFAAGGGGLRRAAGGRSGHSIDTRHANTEPSDHQAGQTRLLCRCRSSSARRRTSAGRASSRSSRDETAPPAPPRRRRAPQSPPPRAPARRPAGRPGTSALRWPRRARRSQACLGALEAIRQSHREALRRPARCPSGYRSGPRPRRGAHTKRPVRRPTSPTPGSADDRRVTWTPARIMAEGRTRPRSDDGYDRAAGDRR